MRTAHDRSGHFDRRRGQFMTDTDTSWANVTVYVARLRRHRLYNPGVVPLELIEVQKGEYLGEDDIVRFEDVYGRAGGE